MRTVAARGFVLGASLAVAALFFWRHRREDTARLLAVLLFVIAGAALGPVLHLGGRPVMPLPWET